MILEKNDNFKQRTKVNKCNVNKNRKHLKSLALLIIFYLQFTIVIGPLTGFTFEAEVEEPVAVSAVVAECFLVAGLASVSVLIESFAARISERSFELIAAMPD